jgi:hypothetical protein
MGPSDTFTQSFTSPAAGGFVLWIQNGDDDGNRVESGEVSINGSLVVAPADFSQPPDLIRKPVTLLAGNNSISVTLNGEPGSFITALVLPPGARPDVTVGRLILPFASSSGLVLDLKNGSHSSRRFFRVVFYDPSGAPVAKSDRLFLDPRASLSQAASSLISSGSWSEGSVEIFYAGRGAGRLFGSAASEEMSTGIESIVPLQQAGHRRLEIADQPKKPR